MSAYRMWIITCNGCGEIFDHEPHFQVTSAKATARRYGWSTGRTTKDHDLCPNCREEAPDDR